MNSALHKLVCKIEIVLKGVFGLFRIGDISSVAHGSFDYSAGLLGSVDTELHVFDVVEGVEDSEDVKTILHGLLAELVDGIVRVGSIADSVSTSDERLERDVGDKLSHLAQSLPGIFMQDWFDTLSAMSSYGL